MCRNIRVLHHMDPPTTPDEVHAAAVQYVRKVSGGTSPPRGGEAAFELAVVQIAAATQTLLDSLGALPTRGATRTREGEKLKARERWEKRSQRAAPTK